MSAIAITQLPEINQSLSNPESSLSVLTQQTQLHINAGFRGAVLTETPVKLSGSPYPSTE